MNRKLFVVLAICGVWLLSAGVVMAATFTRIVSPDAAYLADTTKIDIAHIPNHTGDITSVTDGTMEVSFSDPMRKGSVYATWGSWSYAPDSEEDTPHILVSDTDNLTISLSPPAQTFGFEFEPDMLAAFDWTVQFRSEGVTVGTIQQTVHGEEGARLFAGSVEGGVIDEVVINIDDGFADGFAIAQLRYALPEVSATVLTDAGVPGQGVAAAPGLQKEFNANSPAGDRIGGR